MITATKIAQAAKRWADAEKVKKAKRLEFVYAWNASLVTGDNYEYSFPLFKRLSGESLFGSERVYRWVYTEHAGKEKAGKDCDKDQLCVAQISAWAAYRDAGKLASTARGLLTRMVNKWDGVLILTTSLRSLSHDRRHPNRHHQPPRPNPPPGHPLRTEMHPARGSGAS